MKNINVLFMGTPEFAVETLKTLVDNDYNVVAVIGDGALTGGLAFEGLNNAQMDNTNLIVICLYEK